MSHKTPQKEDLPASEIEARRDAALLRALSTPHKKQADMKVGKAAAKVKTEASGPKQKW